MSKIKTIDIKGKAYPMVSERVKAFRSNPDYLSYGIETELLHYNEEAGSCVVKASIYSITEDGAEGANIASGLAREFQADKHSTVNKTSFLENCETSAIGRALACLGIGIEDYYASANEVKNAIEKSKEMDKVAETKAEVKVDPHVLTAEEETAMKARILGIDKPPKIEVPNATDPMLEVREKLIEMNSRAMKITSTAEGKALWLEFEAFTKEFTCPATLTKLVKDSIFASSKRLDLQEAA